MIIDISDIFKILLAVMGVFFIEYITSNLKKISQLVHEINTLLAERSREKSIFHKFVREYIEQGLRGTKRNKLFFIIALLLFFLSFSPYFIWQKDYILWIPTGIILSVFSVSSLLETFYEDTLAMWKGIVKNFPTDFNDLLDRLKIKDEDERKELTKLYRGYEKKGLEKDKKELFNKLP